MRCHLTELALAWAAVHMHCCRWDEAMSKRLQNRVDRKNLPSRIYRLELKAGSKAPTVDGIYFANIYLLIFFYFFNILNHRYLWIFLIYSLYIPYIFPRYVPYIFPCVFLNLWSQEKTSPYRKTTFLFLRFQGLRFLYFYH